MKIETKEIYKCGHCNKLYQIKSWCEYHESICPKNPGNRRLCTECGHFTKKRTEAWVEYFGRGENRLLELCFCTAKNQYMYPPKVGIKQNMYDLGEELNVPMPKECDLYMHSSAPEFISI